MKGLWGHSYDQIIRNKNVPLSKQDEHHIINELEQRLNRLTNKEIDVDEIDIWAAEAAGTRLADYYRKTEQNDEAKRVLLIIGESFLKKSNNLSAIQASSILDHLYRVYKMYNLSDEANDILKKLRVIGKKTTSEMGKISETVKIDRTEMDQFISEIVDSEFYDMLNKLTFSFIPRKDDAKKSLLTLSKEAPLQYLLKVNIQDNKGRVIARIGSLQDDMEGRIIENIAQSLFFSSIYLRKVIESILYIKKINLNDIFEFLFNSPFIEDDRYKVIIRGINSFYEQDYLVAIHLLVPQIEEIFRNITEKVGGNVLKPARNGGYKLKLFDEILREEITVKTFGEDISDYFRILFTDPRGWNIRNNVCHGLVPFNQLNSIYADRIFHTLILLGLLK
jgi:hypothetical protein